MEAVKIQKLFRGHITRKQLNEKKAATRIQKRARGNSTRKRINALRNFSKNPRSGSIIYAEAVKSNSVPTISKSAFFFSKLKNPTKMWDTHLSSFSNTKSNLHDAINRLKYLMLEQSTDNAVKDPDHFVPIPDDEESGIQIFKLNGERIDSEMNHYGNMRTNFGNFINQSIQTHYNVTIYIFEFENITIIISVDDEGLWGDRIKAISRLLR